MWVENIKIKMKNKIIQVLILHMDEKIIEQSFIDKSDNFSIEVMDNLMIFYG